VDIPTAVDLAAERGRRALEDALPPSLLPLPHIAVTAEAWEEERHVRVRGDAIYAVHRGSEAWWAVVVRESNTVAPGAVRLIPVSEIRCESSSGRRGG
jgi:hypothetical protein